MSTRDCKKCKNNEKDEMCVICQNKFEEKDIFKRLDCEHNYHYKCIRKWLLACENKKNGVIQVGLSNNTIYT